MNELKWTKSNGTYNARINGHKLRIVKADKYWELKILKRKDIENNCTQFDTLWDDFKTLKDAKEEADLINFNF